jgi:hypothetical protein
LVRIFVAIHTLRKCDRLLKVAVCVALNAINARMFTEQRKLRFRMIEPLVLGYLLPTGSCVARLAGLRKRAVMRVVVTIAALGKGDSGESRFLSRFGRRVAFLACDLCVKSRKRITCCVVIELLRCLPIHEIVTLEAVLAELALVRILMARDAILGQT